jgi:alpha-amylase
MKKVIGLFLLQSFTFLNIFCQTAKTTDNIDGHPAWIMQGNIYEVNVRQPANHIMFLKIKQRL